MVSKVNGLTDEQRELSAAICNRDHGSSFVTPDEIESVGVVRDERGNREMDMVRVHLSGGRCQPMTRYKFTSLLASVRG